MTHAQYVNAGPAGTGRGGTRDRNTAALWLVLHTSEGGEGPTSAENLASFIRTPASGSNVASYQAITDTDRILQIMDDAKRCHGAAGANDQGLHLCFPGAAAQSRTQWLDGVSAAYIEQAARWCADKCVKHGIPPVLVGSADLKAGRRGICDHNQVRLAFGQTTHTDVGPNFPWDVLLALVRQLLAGTPTPTPQEDEMLLLVRANPEMEVWSSNGVWRYHIPSQAALDALLVVAAASGSPVPPIVDIGHDQLPGFGIAIGP